MVGGALALYTTFLLWYGGRGRPLSTAEVDAAIAALDQGTPMPGHAQLLGQLRDLLSNDDGAEFVMHNLVRYRARAAYPPGYNFDDDPRKADQRYGRAILWPLLRHGSHPVFIARRSGRFIDPEAADQWHYVAMVRYRSRRDFLRFALMIEHQDIAVHKWAAIAKTHVFPVQPLVSLVLVRAVVGMALALVGVAAHGLLG